MPVSKTSSELKKLMRAALSPDEFIASIGPRENDDDRTAAIVVAAIVENLLADTIRNKMQHLNSTEDKALFENNGPLATFSAKIQVAYAMKLFNKNVVHDLGLI